MRPISIGMELGTVRPRYARAVASALRSSTARYVRVDEPRFDARQTEVTPGEAR